MSWVSNTGSGVFLYSWGPVRAAVPEGKSVSQRSLKCQFFVWKSYCTSTCSWLVRSISTCWSIYFFFFQCLLLLSYQGQILFTRRIVKHWNRLLREAADSPSLEIFETKLGMTLSWWKVEAGLLWVGNEPSRKPSLPKSLRVQYFKYLLNSS